MSTVNSFTPSGQTISFTGNTSAPTPVQATSPSSSSSYRIINSGTSVVFLGVGSDSATSAGNAGVITTSGAAIPLLAGTDEILSFSPNAFFTGITSSGSSVVYITPGTGI